MKFLERIKKFSKAAAFALIGLVATAVAMGTNSYADAAVPTSLMDAEALGIVTDFSADLVPTVLALIAVVIPVALTLFGVGFALKKGLNYLQAKASKAL